MSSSGLIYAVIVGAWAAYLVPMWLRRQDELNEARPTERFSTAIRLLSGRAAMERRYAKELQDRGASEAESDVDPDAVTDRLSSVDVRAFAVPPTQPEHPAAREEVREQARGKEGKEQEDAREERRARTTSAAAERARRSKVLARRRRTTVVLFLAFTLGAIVAAVGGLQFLWAPAVPAVLLSTYIVHLRTTERRRFAFTMDRRRAEVAAQRLRERRPQGRRPVAVELDEEPVVRPEPEPAPAVSPQEAGRRALVEQTDHAEWVDQQRERERGSARGESWDPVPVPLPTYVTAPVAPRATGSVDFGDPGTWSSARSSTAEPTPAPEPPPATDTAPHQRTAPSRRGRDSGRTPLFDQYADEDRPRAVNE
ncbi:gephyrin-like molybdotransferase receptor GlpR [Streptomyces spiramyceticus]|uniref:divisome protein SepX/GlpR n=1 Tax=Streptomyces spiramyceticus TaxID=299717 RepID=UPI00237A28FA|nr:gephyrin-like molybdotransferase receptor GlpR [Streptomyces spiramyceticus]